MNKVQLGNITLYNNDCMNILRNMRDKEYDLAIVDCPYGIGIDGQKGCVCKNPKHNRKTHENKGWDKTPPPLEYFQELRRVSKEQIIWGGNYFVQNLTPSKGWIVWDKGQYGLTMSDCELAYSSFDVPARFVTINRCELIKQNTFHPTEKPIKLYKWLLHNYAKEGDKILDTHLGSGSIAIACHDMGFHLTGIELDKDYFDKAVKRIRMHQRQLKLW